MKIYRSTANTCKNSKLNNRRSSFGEMLASVPIIMKDSHQADDALRAKDEGQGRVK